MAKTPSTRLFLLVKSLSGAEKRYFHIATQSDKGGKYIQLFDAIEAQDVFDEAALQMAVYGQYPVAGKKYSELKAYLYDALLKHLADFDAQASVDNTLKAMLLSIRSLFKRRLIDDCRYQLRRAKKLASTHEQFVTLLELLDWEKQIMYAEADIDFFDRHLTDIHAQETACLAKMDNLKGYETLFYELYVLMRKNTLKSEAGQRQIEAWYAHPLLADEAVCGSYKARVLYYRIHAILRHQQRQMDAFYDYCKRLLAVMESDPLLLRDETAHYIAALSNFATSCGYEGRYDELNDCLQKLRKVTPTTLDDALKIHRQYYTNYFSLCINTGRFDEGVTALRQHLQEAETLDKHLFERSSFYFQYFYIYFGVGDFSEALTHLNRWLDLPRTIEQQDLQSLARLLNLLVHFELGNTLVVDSLLRSTHRKLSKAGQLNAFEQFFVQALRQANQAATQREQRTRFTHSLQRLRELDLQPADRAILRFFDFESWLEAKATQTPFGQVVQRRL